NLGGIDETDDMRPGLGMTGVANLAHFVEDGGLLITARDTSVWAVQYGLARWVRTIEPQKLKAPGTILLANVVDKKSPIAAGYEGFMLPEDAPWSVDYAMPRVDDRPRVILAFAKPADKLLLSGMLEGGDELAGKAVVIDAPRGKGHILLFANNPMWRANTQGSYALVMNAMLNWDALR